MRRFTWVAVLAASLWVYCGSEAAAATLEPIGSFDRPIFVTSDPNDHDRLLVVERDGLVMEANPGGVTVFADLTEWVSCCSGERGLLSIAPAPDFASFGRFYAAYTGEVAAGGVEGDIHVDAFRPDPGAAGEPIREPILSIGHDQLTHNGGQLQFGPDGYLYLSTGDGGGVGDPLGSGQNIDTLLGKILRIDPHPGEEPSYAIPPGNPFVGQAGLDEIWSYGLRNPWRFSFDRASGDMVIADVGQGAREEVDHARSPAAGVVAGGGANYGWNCREGTIAYSGAPAECAGLSGFTNPVFDYPHSDPGGGAAHGCSITGGYVVRDLSLGDLYGRYVYADFCVGQIRSLVLPGATGGLATGDRSEGLAVANPTSFGEDSCGRLYVTSNGGAVYRLEGAVEPVCPIAGQGAPGSETGSTGSETASTNPRKRRRTRLRLSAKEAGARMKIVVRASRAPIALATGCDSTAEGGPLPPSDSTRTASRASSCASTDARPSARCFLCSAAGRRSGRGPSWYVIRMQRAEPPARPGSPLDPSARSHRSPVPREARSGRCRPKRAECRSRSPSSRTRRR